VYVNDVLARHGCTHLLTTNELDSNMQAATTPALHAVVKICIQRKVLESGRPTPWSHHKAAAAQLCFGSRHLHCRKGHMDSTQLQDLDDTATKKMFAKPMCKHLYIMDCLVRGLGAKRVRSDVIVDGLPRKEAFTPECRKELYFDNLKRADTGGGFPQYYRFANEYHSIASQVLPGGLGAMHAPVFSPALDRQAERYAPTAVPFVDMLLLRFPHRLQPLPQVRQTVESSPVQQRPNSVGHGIHVE